MDRGQTDRRKAKDNRRSDPAQRDRLSTDERKDSGKVAKWQSGKDKADEGQKITDGQTIKTDIQGIDESIQVR